MIVLLGSHLGENVFTSQITQFAEGFARGAKLIVVDPRYSTAAAKADWWLPIRPGANIGLRDGATVVLENQDGNRSLPVAVRVTPGIRRDCLDMVHGFGQQAPGLRRANGRGASDTGLITRVAVDPLMGGTGMRVNFVRPLPAEGLQS